MTHPEPPDGVADCGEPDTEHQFAMPPDAGPPDDLDENQQDQGDGGDER